MKIKIKSLIISTSFLLVLFCFASADGLPSNAVGVLNEYFGSKSNYSALSSYFTEIFSNTSYFVLADNSTGLGSAFFTSDLNVAPFIVNGYDSSGVCDTVNFYYNRCAFSNIKNYDCRGQFFYCVSFSNSEIFYIQKVVLTSICDSVYWAQDYNTYPDPYYAASGSSTILYGSSYGSQTGSLINDVTFRYILGDVLKFNYYGYIFMGNFEPNLFPINYVEDDRLLVSKSFNSAGDELLNIDFSKFFSYSPAAIREPRNINITLECDGVNQNFVLDSSSSEIISIYRSNNIRYVYITPYSFFNIGSYDSVILKNVSFDDYGSSAGGSGIVNSYNILCNFVMKNITNDIVSDDILLPSFEDPEVVTDSIINNMKSELHEFSSRYSFLNGTWNFISESDLPSISSWATVYENYVWFGDVNSDTTYQGHWFQMANNIPSIADLSRSFDPAAFIEENKMWSYYDVIKIKVFTVSVQGQAIPHIDNYSLAGYLVLFSDRYYEHYVAENQLNIIKILQFDAENNVLYFGYLKDKLDDFENKSLLGFNSLIDLNKTSNTWLATINGSVYNLEISLKTVGSDIIAAINNIDIPESPDLGEITDSLEYLFIPTFSWSSINYNEYLDSLGILSMPFRFGSSVFSGLENGYSPNLEYHLYEASVPLPSSLGVSGNSFKLWDDQDFTLVTASIVPDQDLLANIRLFNLIVCIMSQAFLTYLHIFRREGGVEDGI